VDMDWYAEWVRLHCQATGADAAAARALLSEIVRAVLLNGGTTSEELGEVTARLVTRHETPKFANEHADAVGLELVRLREERRVATLPGPAAAPGNFAPDCPACGGSGLVVVPHARCVWQGRLVVHPDQGKLVTGAALCDGPGCAAGEVARTKERARVDNPPRRPTLSQVRRHHGCDVLAMLRQHERDQAAAARRRTGPAGDFPAMAAILERAKRRADAA